MIWFFLMGMIAGAVGTVMFAGWWIRQHTTVVKITKEDVEKAENEDGHSY